MLTLLLMSTCRTGSTCSSSSLFRLQWKEHRKKKKGGRDDLNNGVKHILGISWVTDAREQGLLGQMKVSDTHIHRLLESALQSHPTRFPMEEWANYYYLTASSNRYTLFSLIGYRKVKGNI